MKFLSSKGRRWLAIVIVLAALFVLRPGASRLKSKIIHSISAGVGRPADVGSVHLRLLPRPGFDLANLVVYDDPAFGAEPILRASEVTAYLRLSSLLRGRLEVARLELTEPSLNLAHDDRGRWNLAALVERTARTPTAPTGKAKSEPRPGFPYIEGSSGRINFKIGAEKKPYALTSADFSVWQDSENSWGLRLRAQPFRSDFNLNDMGLLRIDGTWQRADSLRETPLQVTVEWSRAQLGQITKFFSGADQGWRGAVLLNATLKGTPAQLAVSTDATVDDFRRYDIPSGTSLRLISHCDAEYSSLVHEFHDVLCNSPVGDGLISLSGEVGLPRSHRYDIVLRLENIPASGLALLAQRAKKNLPDDLAAKGSLQAKFAMAQNASSDSPRFEGEGEIADFQLSSAASKVEFGPVNVPFSLNTGGKIPRAAKGKSTKPENPFAEGPAIEVGPFTVSSGRSTNATVRGWINRGGYRFTLGGDTEIGKSLKLARLVGLPALSTTADGTAHVDLQVAGAWAGQNHGASGFLPPQVIGTAKLRRVQIATHGAGGLIEVLSGDIALLADGVRVTRLDAKAANAEWTGSLEMPRGCGTLDACPIHFGLSTSQVMLADLNEWVHPRGKNQPWYRLLEGGISKPASVFESLRANGRLSAERLQLGKIMMTHASANLSLENGKAKFADLSGDILGGKQRGQWSVSIAGKSAICEGNGNLSGVALDGLSDQTDQRWITGTLNASYRWKSVCADGFWPAADATLQFEVKNGNSPKLSLREDSESLRFSRLGGTAELNSGKIEIKDTVLESSEGQYQISGTASLQQEIDLTVTRANGTSGSGFTVTGTLPDPRVTPLAAEEQAHLKAASANTK